MIMLKRVFPSSFCLPDFSPLEKLPCRAFSVLFLAVFLIFASVSGSLVSGAEKEAKAAKKPSEKSASRAKNKPKPKPKKLVDPVVVEIKILTSEAQGLLKEKKFEEAREKYRRARELRPEQSTWTQAIYKAYYKEGNWPKAVKTALELLKKHPGSQSNAAAYECARQMTRYKKYGDAAALYEALLVAQPENLSYMDQLIASYQGAERYDDIIWVGEASLRSFVQYYAENPEKEVAARGFITLLARAYLKQGVFEEASARIKSRVLDGAPGRVRDVVLTRILEEGERWEKARKAAEYKAFRNLVGTLEREGQALLKKKSFDEARQRFLKLMELQPERDDLYSRIFQCFLGEGDMASARAVALEAIELYPDGRSARALLYDYARRVYKVKDYALAIEPLKTLWSLEPSKSYYLDMLFRCFIEEERYEDVLRLGGDALRMYEDYYRLNPEKEPYRWSFFLYLVRAAVEEDKVDDLLAQGEGSRLFAPKEPARVFIQKTMLDEAARLLYERKEYAKARPLYFSAAELSPERIEPLRGIYNSYVREKNYTEAQVVALRAFEIDSSNKTSYMVMDCARRLVEKRNYSEAIAPLELLFAKQTENFYAFDMLFQCYGEEKRNADLIRLGEAAVDSFIQYHVANPSKKPTRRSFLSYLAKAYRDEGLLGEAIGRTEALLDDSASSGSVKVALSSFLRQEGYELQGDEKLEEAAEVFKRAMALTPQDSTSVRDLAGALFVSEGPEACTDMLRAAMREYPSNEKYLRNDLANFHYRAKQYDQAEDLFREMVVKPGTYDLYESRLLSCLLYQEKFAEATEMLDGICAIQGAVGEEDRKKRKILDRVAEVYLRVARGLRKNRAAPDASLKGPLPVDEASDYLEECAIKLPEYSFFRNELAYYHFQDRRYDKAEVLYREMLKEEPRNQLNLSRFLDCLVQVKKYEEAARVFEENIKWVENSSLSESQKRKAVLGLEKKYMGALDGEGILENRIRSLQERVADFPTSATLHNRLGDMFIQADLAQMALGEHLLAGRLGGDADVLAEQGLRLAKVSRGEKALGYLDALVEHFPLHPRVFEALESMVRLRGEYDKRFAFSPLYLSALSRAERTCQRIIENPLAPPEMAAEARLKELVYHYEPLSSKAEIWQSARSRALALLDGEAMTGELRVKVLRWVMEIDAERLNDPRSAYGIAMRIATEEPEAGNFIKLAELSSRLHPRPEPVMLRRYLAGDFESDEELSAVEERNRKLRATSRPLVEAALTVWLWEMGKRREALDLVEPHRESARVSGTAWSDSKRFLESVKRQCPELAERMSKPATQSDFAAALVLTREEVWETKLSGIGPEQGAIHYERSLLEVPGDLFSRKTVAFFSAERPLVVRPSVFVREATEPRREGIDDRALWTALWRDSEKAGEAAGGVESYSLDSAHVETFVEDVRVERLLVDEGDKEGNYLFQVLVHSRKPFSLSVKMDRSILSPSQVWPATGEVDSERRIVRFENLEESADEDGVSSFSLRFRFPRSKNSLQQREPLLPGVELVMDQDLTTGTLDAPSEGLWSLETRSRENEPSETCRFEIRSSEILPEPVAFSVKQRKVYRLDAQGRR